MGYNVADNMNAQNSVVTLKMAVNQKKKTPLINHSDRDLQYCANDYQSILNKNEIFSSLTQNSDPYENAVAERINGILK